MSQAVDRIITGYKSIVGDKKNDGIMSVKEGKSEISFAGFEALCMANLVYLIWILCLGNEKMQP